MKVGECGGSNEMGIGNICNLNFIVTTYIRLVKNFLSVHTCSGNHKRKHNYGIVKRKIVQRCVRGMSV